MRLFGTKPHRERWRRVLQVLSISAYCITRSAIILKQNQRRMAMRLYGLGYSLSVDDGSVAASSGFSSGFFSLGLVSKI